MSGFDGKVVLVTGASGNLGQAVWQAFAREGARLALVDRHKEELLPQLEALGIAPDRYHILEADLTDGEQVNTMVEHFAAHFGQIDVLAHTVGGYAAGQPVHEAGIDVWDKMINLNARPVYLTGGAVAKHMVEKGIPGAIIITLARAALKGTKNHGAYTASKAAAQRIVESMAAELRDQNIRVNAILPGTIDTPPNRQAMPKADFSKWVKPEELADTIVYLASERASAVMGASVEVYGRS